MTAIKDGDPFGRVFGTPWIPPPPPPRRTATRLRAEVDLTSARSGCSGLEASHPSGGGLVVSERVLYGPEATTTRRKSWVSAEELPTACGRWPGPGFIGRFPGPRRFVGLFAFFACSSLPDSALQGR